MLVRDRHSQVVGLITVGDILRFLHRHGSVIHLHAKDIMSSPVIYTSADTELEACEAFFAKNKITRLVLKDHDGNIVGVLRKKIFESSLPFAKLDRHVREEHEQRHRNTNSLY